MTANASEGRARWQPLLRAALIMLAVVTGSGCSMFGGGDDDKELEPTELVKFEQTLKVKKI